MRQPAQRWPVHASRTGPTGSMRGFVNWAEDGSAIAAGLGGGGLRCAGGRELTPVRRGQGGVDRGGFGGGGRGIQMALPRPRGTASVVLAGGASQAMLSLPAGVPARLRLDGGAASARLASQTYTGVAGGTVLAAAGWARAASRYDIDAPAGVSAISV